VLAPFTGSGTTVVAAVRAGRHFAGYDVDETYVRLAEARVEEKSHRLLRGAYADQLKVRLRAVPAPAHPDEDFQSRAVREGLAAKEIARSVIEAAGFTDIEEDRRQPGGLEANFGARDCQGKLWL